MRKKKIKEFNFMKREKKKQKKEILIYVDVNVAPGK